MTGDHNWEGRQHEYNMIEEGCMNMEIKEHRQSQRRGGKYRAFRSSHDLTMVFPPVPPPLAQLTSRLVLATYTSPYVIAMPPKSFLGRCS